VTSEPFEVERKGGFKPNVFLLADHGYSSYATTIVTRREIVDKNPISCSVSSTRRQSAGTITSTATMQGERRHQERQPRNDGRTNRIFRPQAERTWHHRLRRYPDQGHRRDDRRAREGFFDQMVKAGLVKPTTDFKKAYTLQFVNKGVGLDLRPK